MSDGPAASIFTARARLRQESRELMTALVAGAEPRMRSVVAETLERSGSLLYVVSHLVDTARQDVEDMWYRGELGLLDEQRMLGRLQAAVAAVARDIVRPARFERRCTLIATDAVAGAIDQALLQEDGWQVRRVAIDDAAATIDTISPVERRLVVIVGGASVARPELKSMVGRLKSLGSRVLMTVPDQWAHAGGWLQLGADEWAGNAQTLVLMARKLFAADSSFSISEVAATLGVTPHAIRAWERRYALPVPKRDRGGQRRYTTEDVHLLLRMSHSAAVHRRSLKLAALEAQGLLADDGPDVVGSAAVPAIERAGPVGQPWLRVADAMPDMLMLIDAEGTILDCNVATARARNTVRENLRGTRLVDLIIEYDRAKAIRLYRPSPRRRDGWELRMRGTNQDFTVVSFDSRLVEGQGGRILGLIGRTILPESPAAA